ncbi:flagellar export protein FliJ [Acidaminobacter sp. JC074]|uniref:flagellar export protein FliJ n=1 Tax=Acidaminobacter sp. JC074 TaxID=2530199 RepID=UPI001F0FAF24|nr:flagellar export protein FliJ [Acidaminobacter sp. JC074]MCH4888721.1 flagellar export protein FliJ [Acidaminobacter sp. JC074]
MKKFVFRFEKILQVRIDKENEVRNLLGKVNKRILEKEEEFKGVHLQYETFLNQLNSNMKAGVRAGDMRAVAANKSFLIDKMDQLKRELNILMDERKRIQGDLIEANKQRKIMEKLKEKEIEKYKAHEAMEEAKTVDQIVTYQSTKTKGE